MKLSTGYENIYGLIESIKQRPGMYSPSRCLADVEKMLWGYADCLRVNGIAEAGVDKPFDNRSFSNWLYKSRGWSSSLGFAHAIQDHTSSIDEAWNLFFELVKEYKSDIEYPVKKDK